MINIKTSLVFYAYIFRVICRMLFYAFSGLESVLRYHCSFKEYIFPAISHKYCKPSRVQISFRRLTKVAVNSKFRLKLTDVKRLSTT